MAAPKGNQFGNKDRLLRNAALNILDEHPEGRMAAAKEIMRPIVEKAKEGDLMAAKELIDRIDGKAHQTSEIAVTKTDVRDYTTDELIAALGSLGDAGEEASKGSASNVH